MAKILNQGLKLSGDILTRGGVQLTAFLFDASGDILWAKGATVPTDASTGFAVGCLFIDTTGGGNTTLYVNEGTAASSCDFNAAVNT